MVEQDEQERLKQLHSYDILDSEDEQDFDDIVELASHICEAPISLISLIDKDRQWFKAKKGLNVNQTPRDIAFCDHAIKNYEVFEVTDTLEDSRFKENPLVTSDPNLRFYAGQPLTTKEGYNLGTLCVLSDKPKQLNEYQKKSLETLSKRVVKEFELRKKVKELNELNVFKNKLLSIIGHDVKSPLSSIQSVIDMIDKNLITQEELIHIRKLLKGEVQNTISLLDNILEWSSIYLEGKEHTTEPFNIKDLVNECLDLLVFELKKKSIKVEVLLDNEEAYGDGEMIKLVIRNILNNAIKFSKENDSIIIKAESSTDGLIKIIIEDKGIGMSPDQIERLLSKKGGISSLGTNNERGSGVGMLLSLEFLEINQGKLHIESNSGEGSKFIISLPAKKS